MRWLRIFLLLLFPFPVLAWAQQTTATTPIEGFCVNGAQPAITSGLPSSNLNQNLIPQCTVTVFLSGSTGLATIYSDLNQTPLSNPFRANADGSWRFYPSHQAFVFDVVLSGGIAPNVYRTPRTLVGLNSFFGGGGGGGSGAAGLENQVQVNVGGFLGAANTTFQGNDGNVPGILTTGVLRALDSGIAVAQPNTTYVEFAHDQVQGRLMATGPDPTTVAGLRFDGESSDYSRSINYFICTLASGWADNCTFSGDVEANAVRATGVGGSVTPNPPNSVAMEYATGPGFSIGSLRAFGPDTATAGGVELDGVSTDYSVSLKYLVCGPITGCNFPGDAGANSLRATGGTGSATPNSVYMEFATGPGFNIGSLRSFGPDPATIGGVELDGESSDYSQGIKYLVCTPTGGCNFAGPVSINGQPLKLLPSTVNLLQGDGAGGAANSNVPVLKAPYGGAIFPSWVGAIEGSVTLTGDPPSQGLGVGILDYPRSIREARVVSVGPSGQSFVGGLGLWGLGAPGTTDPAWEYLHCSSTGPTAHSCSIAGDFNVSGATSMAGGFNVSGAVLINNSPVCTQDTGCPAGGAGNVTWPPVGIAVSAGAAWGPSIVPATVPRTNTANTFTGTQTIVGDLNVTGNIVQGAAAPATLPVRTSSVVASPAPSSGSGKCRKDAIWHDDNYLYVCIRSGEIKRVTLSAF